MSEEDLSNISSGPANSRYAWRRKPRKFSSKSKKGCKTCKVRRIKCDLVQPYCRKCTSTGRTCDGYSEDPYIIVNTPSTNSEFTISDTDTGPHTKSMHIPMGLRCPLVLYPATSEEHLVLDFFGLKTLPQINGYRKSISWARTIISFSNTVECVHHAALALGSLHRAYIFKNTGGGSDHRAEDSDLFALYHYNLAINHLLNFNGHSGDTTRDRAITLLVCYLFTCFDNLAGNHARVSKHLRSGIALLNETRASWKPTKCSNDEELMDQITEQFRHLDMQASTFLLGWSPQSSLEYSLDSVANIQYRIGPTDIRFTSLTNAADELEGLVLEVLRLRRWESRFRIFRETGVSETSPIYFTTLCDLLNWQNRVVGRLEEWSKAFEVLLKSTSERLSATDKLLVDIMQLHYITAYTFLLMSSALMATAALTEIVYDSVLPQFKTAVELGSKWADNYVASSQEEVQKMANTEPSFTVEFGIIPALYLIGMKCRDPLLRREIISILRRTPRREGMWESVSTARVLERVMKMEEGHDDADFELGIKTMVDIPRDRRVKRAHWGPVNGLFGTPGAQVEMIYEICCSSGNRKTIREDIVL